ncbi:MAG: hypothetical protein WC890_01270 [Candidatus Margulisiibacteriota bacterium]
MKKIVLFLLVIFTVGSMSAFAATAKASAKAKATGWVFGVENSGLVNTPLPYISFALNDSQAVDVGLSYVNANSNNNGITAWGRLDNKIADFGSVTTNWGVGLALQSGKTAGQDFNTITLNGILGVEYAFTSILSVYGNVNVLTLSSQTLAGNSSTAYSVLTGDNLLYTGFKVRL